MNAPSAEKDAGVVTWTMPREDALDLLGWLRHNRPLGMPDRTFDGLLDALAPGAEKDAGVEKLERWRAQASQLGGIPAHHPHVPAEYVYMANRMVDLIDSVIRAGTTRGSDA